MQERMVYWTNPDGNVSGTSPKMKRNLLVWSIKLKDFNTAPKCKYGYEISRTYEQAKQLDQKNGNTKWGDSKALELGQIDEYTTFIDKGHHTKVNPSSGFKKIRVNLVFDVKHDGRHKARLVVDGHLTDIPLDSVY
jgi:hypothetical protein